MPDLNHDLPLIVDLFAGGGGASTAIFLATGRHPDVAVNHDADAIAIHTINHPTTRHYQEDVRTVDPIQAITFDGKPRRVGLLWASPDCTHFSKARGGKPVQKGIRSLADVVVVWVREIKKATGRAPDIVMLENVEEFQDWGPVLEDGKPCPENKGLDFRRWVKELTDLGGRAEWREPVAANWGAPTTRRRLQMIIRFDGLPIVWPESTHVSRTQWEKHDLFNSTKSVWRSAADDVIDWSIPVPSIFGRRKPLAPNTHKRIAKGIRRFVIESKKPFIVPITHSGPGRVHDVDDPLRTVTSANRGEFSLISPSIIPHYGERDGQAPRVLDPQEPYPTVVPGGRGGDLAATFMQKMAQNGVGTSLDEPLDTVMAGATKHHQVAALLSGVAHGDGRPRAGLRAWSAEEPLGTITGSNDRVVATAFMAQANGDRVGREVEEPVTTLTGRSTQQNLAVPLLDKYYATGVAQSPEQPLDTVTSKGRFGLGAAFMEQANTGMVGHAAEEPVSTIVGKGSTQRVVHVGLISNQYTSNTNGGQGDPEQPVGTVTAQGGHQAVVDVALEMIGAPPGSKRRAVLEFLWHEFEEPTDEEWADPMATAAGRLKFGLVVIDDVVWQISDIGMRMLTPRELFNAQGFPRDYVIDITLEGRPITKTAQTRMAGNSVSPPPARAHLEANLPAEMILKQAA